MEQNDHYHENVKILRSCTLTYRVIGFISKYLNLRKLTFVKFIPGIHEEN